MYFVGKDIIEVRKDDLLYLFFLLKNHQRYKGHYIDKVPLICREVWRRSPINYIVNCKLSTIFST